MARVSKNLQTLKRQIDNAQRCLNALSVKLSETQAALAAASSAYLAEMAERDTVPVAGEKRSSRSGSATEAAVKTNTSRSERKSSKDVSAKPAAKTSARGERASNAQPAQASGKKPARNQPAK